MKILSLLLAFILAQPAISQVVLTGEDAAEFLGFTSALNNFSRSSFSGFKRRSDLEEWRYEDSSRYPQKMIEHSDVLERNGIIFWWKLREPKTPSGKFEVHFENASKEDVAKFFDELQSFKINESMLRGDTLAEYESRKAAFLKRVRESVLPQLSKHPKPIVPEDYHKGKPVSSLAVSSKIRSGIFKCRAALSVIGHWILHPGN